MFKKQSTREKVLIEKSGETAKMPLPDRFKNRQTLGIICISAAIFIAFVGSPMVEQFASRNIDVPVAADNIKKGEMLTDENVKIVQMGAKNLPEGKLEEKNQAVGSYATVDLMKGDVLTNVKISSESLLESACLSNLADGQLAISVMLKDADLNLAGKLRAGDLISIYEVLEGQAILHKELSCVEVLAVTNAKGADITDSDDMDEVKIETVTLSVNDTQAELLAGLGGRRLHAALVYRGDDARKRDTLLGRNTTGGADDAG